MLGPTEWFRRSPKITGWLTPEPPGGTSARRPKAQRRPARYPAQARVPQEGVTVRASATLSTQEQGHLDGATRAYLEREDAHADVLQDAPFEQWPERWAVWVSPSLEDGSPVNSFKVAHEMSEHLRRRFGASDKDVYAVEHVNVDRNGRMSMHVHLVVKPQEGMDLSRKEMTRFARGLAQELAIERNLDRALERDP